MAELKVGMAAPDFSLPGKDGKIHRLSDYRGKNVVVYFYPRDDTPGCTTEACGFRDNMPKLLSANAVVLGISTDDGKSHSKFASKYKLNFTLLSDEGHTACDRYGVWEKKKFMGREFMGINRSTFVVDGAGKIVAAMYGVNPNGHAQEILRALGTMI